MAADDPIRIGTAAASALIAEAGSHIATDDFGVQHGTIRHWLGDQSLAQSSRFTLGAAYSGSLPQYSGFYVEKSGDITGTDGKCANLDVQYAKIDSLYAVPTVVGVESEVLQLKLGDAPTGLDFLNTLYVIPITIPHPTVGYSFSATSRTNKVGTYGTPSGVPDVQNFTFKANQFVVDSASVQSVASISGVILNVNTNLTCSTEFFTGPNRLYAQITSRSQNSTLNITFIPDPSGWLCMQDNSTSICSGAIYLISQKWVRRYIFSSISGGILWTGTCVP